MSPTRAYPARTGDGVRIVLHRLEPRAPRHTTPVLLVAGTFSTRTFWLGTRGQGFGRFLAEAGFDIWILEPRGHGASERPASWTLEDWIRQDAPAALDRVLDATGARDCFWVGHSAGGVVGAAAVGACPQLAARLRGLVLIGAPGPVGVRGLRRWVARSGHLAAGLFPRVAVPGTLLGLGPEPEPTPLIRQWMGWNLQGAWRGSDGGDYLDALDAVEVPLLALAGAGDRWLAPPEAVRDLARRFGSEDRTLVLAGTRQGFREEYGHAELIVSRNARQEIWPLLRDWLEARAGE